MTTRHQHAGILIALSLLGACLLGGLAAPLVAAALADDFARSLLPPVYPSSELIRSSGRELWRHVHYEDRVYYSPDSPEEVLAFLEQHMPGFALSRDLALRICYSNSREVRGLPLDGLLARNLTWPSAHVIVCPSRSGGTEIVTSAMWPEP